MRASMRPYCQVRLAVPELLVMPVRMRPLVKLPLESRMARMTKWPWPS
jgi:hypothetical protein